LYIHTRTYNEFLVIYIGSFDTPSTKQSTNQPINLSTYQPINLSTNQPTSHLILPIKSSHISNKNINFANP